MTIDRSNPINSYFSLLPRDALEQVFIKCDVWGTITLLSSYNFDVKTRFIELAAINLFDASRREEFRFKDCTFLNIFNHKMVSIPLGVFKLSHLTKLYLVSCAIFKVSEEIGNLRHLSELDLHSNNIVRMPAELGKLTELTLLNLSSNRLKTLPAEMGNLVQLRYLYIHNNPDMKEVPNIEKLKLKMLEVNGSTLSYPDSIRDIPGIWILDLDSHTTLRTSQVSAFLANR